MEDILASIRRIISDDQNGGGKPAPSAAPVEHSHQEIDENTAYRNGPQDGEESASVAGLRARLPEPTGLGMAQEGDRDMLDHTLPAVNDDGEDGLLSAPLGESVMSAFEALAATVVLQNTPMLERVMRDLLRPMLKTWLDDNLPALVERLVRTEIERVARGNRG